MLVAAMVSVICVLMIGQHVDPTYVDRFHDFVQTLSRDGGRSWLPQEVRLILHVEKSLNLFDGIQRWRVFFFCQFEVTVSGKYDFCSCLIDS